MATRRARARLATTHAIPAYGGIKLGKGVMHQLAEALRNGSIPMHLNHDATRPLAVSNVESGVEQLDDGEWAAWAEFDVDSDEWSAWQDELAEKGAAGGMSFSFHEPVVDATSPEVLVFADAHHFRDDDLRQAALTFSELGLRSSASRLYQFSFIPEALVVLELTAGALGSLGPNIAASYIYDCLKTFMAPCGERTTFNIHVKFRASGARSVKIKFAAASTEDLKSIVAQTPGILHEAMGNGVYVLDEGTGRLREI